MIEKRILSAGTVHEFHNNCDHEAHLCFVGSSRDGEYLNEMLSLSRSGKADDNIHFLDSIDHILVSSYLSEADVFCLPSFTENFGIAIVEQWQLAALS